MFMWRVDMLSPHVCSWFFYVFSHVCSWFFYVFVLCVICRFIVDSIYIVQRIPHLTDDTQFFCQNMIYWSFFHVDIYVGIVISSFHTGSDCLIDYTQWSLFWVMSINKFWRTAVDSFFNRKWLSGQPSWVITLLSDVFTPSWRFIFSIWIIWIYRIYFRITPSWVS